MKTPTPFTTPGARRRRTRRRRLAAAGAGVALAAVGAGALAAFGGGGDHPGRTIVAVDATVALDARERAALVAPAITEAYVDEGRPVAVYRFGANASQAAERLPFTRRSHCEDSCGAGWTEEADRIVAIASAVDDAPATSSGVLEGLCALPTRPGDTVILVSDLAQRSEAVNTTRGRLDGPDRVEAVLAAARNAGLVCPQMRGIHLRVVGFGSDGLTGPASEALRTFWTRLANEAGVASIDIRRFAG